MFLCCLPLISLLRCHLHSLNLWNTFCVYLSHSIWWSMRVFMLLFKSTKSFHPFFFLQTLKTVFYHFTAYSTFYRVHELIIEFYFPIINSKRLLRNSLCAKKICRNCSVGLPRLNTRLPELVDRRKESMSWEIKSIYSRWVSSCFKLG